jgi:hypothetical protein
MATMSHEDPLAAFEDALFRAARRERARSNALERTTNAVVAAHRRRRVQRRMLALGGAVALAAGAMLMLRTDPGAESIQAEQIAPKHAVSSVAAPSLPSQADTAAEPILPVSDDAGALRSGRAPSVSSTTLEEEVVMLNRAREELTAGKAESALSLLDQYDRVAGGHLTAEATLLRIQVLSSSGHGALATKLARRLVDSDPTGAVAARARAYIPKP